MILDTGRPITVLGVSSKINELVSIETGQG